MVPPKLSVILNSHNRPQYLAEAISSVLRQNMSNLELLVIDHNSVPDIHACFRGEVEKDPRVRGIFLYRNLGNVRGSNLGASLACGEYLAFLDDDNRDTPDFALKMTAYLDDHPEAAAVVCDSEVIRCDGWRTGESRGSKRFDLLKRVNTVDHNELMVRKSLWDELGGFDERAFYCHDWEFALRLQPHGIGYIPEMLTEYRIHDSRLSNLTGRPGCRLCLEESIHYIREKHGLLEELK